MHAFVNDSTVEKLASPPLQARLLDFWEQLVLEERVHSSFSFVSPLTNLLTDFSGFIVRRRMVSYIYILLKSLSGWFKWGRKPSTPGEKGENDLACHRLYLASHCFLMRLKTEAQKRRILKVLKIAHENFTWSGREISHVGRYGGHKWKIFLVHGVGCTRSIPSQYGVLGLAGYQANT